MELHAEALRSFRKSLAIVKDKTPESIMASLSQQLCAFKEEFEEAGVGIDGYSGSSKEGPVWMFHFIKVWSIPPDSASATVHVWWSDWPNGNEVRVVRLAEIYRQSQVSSFKDKVEDVLSVDSVIDNGIRRVVGAAIEEARVILEKTSNTVSNPAILPPLHIGKTAG